jgi:TRAP-type C4-dicarboxylate transport system substrate-binding protein
VFVGAVNAMGASATPMNFGEVYTSLQSGVLDGFEHTATTTASFKFYEIAKYYALTQHLIDPTVVAYSLSEWKKLDAKEQAVVTEGAKLATDIARAMSPVRDAEGMAELQKRGMTITRPDMSEARKAAAGVQQEMAVKLKAEHLLKQILEQQ